MNKNIIKLLLFIPAVTAVLYFSYKLDFTQDDSYITFRYVENFLNGDGLVYNIGERVEGITNFGWAIYLILWGALGFNYIFIAQLTGLIAGIMIIVLTYLIAKLILPENKLLIWLSVYLIAVNQSFAYWSISGLETSLFSLLAMLALYLYLTGNYLLISSLALLVVIRPEGALIAGILILLDTIKNRSLFNFALKASAVALIISIPFVIFKLYYYNSLLPNPFYAKTGLNVELISSGFEYAIRFFSHYGFYGFGLIIPLFYYKKINETVKTILGFTILYIIYIILVGGDVLKVHRFFFPLFGLNVILIVYSLKLLFDKMELKTAVMLSVFSGMVLLALTFYLPNKFVNDYNFLEKYFIKKMSFMAENLDKYDSTNFSVALPTIGIFGYKLIGHDIIDMVGLCDSTIARHAETEIEGMTTTWKERKHNTKYILSQKPDYILFSTGVKPSAPAEKALLLYPAFLESYRTIGWYYEPNIRYTGTVQSIFKRVKDYDEIEQVYPYEFVENYKIGLDYKTQKKYYRAIEYFDKAISISPEPVYIYLLYNKAKCLLLLRDMNGIKLLDSVLAIDSSIFLAHNNLYILSLAMKDKEKAEIHASWLKKLVPGYWEHTRSSLDKRLIQYNKKAK